MKRAISSLCLALPLLAISPGCSSSSSEPEAAPQTTSTKRKRRKRRAAKPEPKKTGYLPRGHVVFDVKRADLKTQVLPLFLDQAGVEIKWGGPPREVTMRLLKPVHWRDALSLVCRFSDTHLVRDYTGRWVLRDGWSGDLDGEIPEEKGGPPASNSGGVAARGGGRSSGSSGSSRGATSSGSSRSSSNNSGKQTWENTYGGGSDNAAGRTARGLLQGTTTRHSGRK